MTRHDETRIPAPTRSARGRILPLAAAGAMFGMLCISATPGDTPASGQPGGPLPGLTKLEYRLWLTGREVFDRNFTVATGLGVPEFNADSCRACHGDPVIGGAGGLELNVARFGHDGNGMEAFTNLPGGQAASKLRPPPDGTRENIPEGNPNPADNADVFEQRQTPTLLGMGLIDGISDATILANEDPTDSNGDGIFGVARVLMVAGQPEVGRFGWKAQVPHTGDFARDAMGGENGITTPDDGRGFAFVTDADLLPDPELPLSELNSLIFFLNNLAPPIPRDLTLPTVQAGQLIFSALRCDRCHIPTLEGAAGPVPLYSDLLLHDVMGDAFRGMAEPGAGVGMYRTPPRWGRRDTAPYMHDGRAATLTDAILGHFAEGLYSKTGFQALTQIERRYLLEFLNSL
jgi:CxxC motif-containing protein (DUF1111 family)